MGRAAPASSTGPRSSHVVLLDGGRTALLGTEFEEMLRCIRCGACLNVCPVYATIGGHAYGGVYPGPMGAVLTPLLSNGAEGSELPGPPACAAPARRSARSESRSHDLLVKLRAKPGAAERSPAPDPVLRAVEPRLSVPRVYRWTSRVANLARRHPRLSRRLPVARAWCEGRALPTR